MEWRTTNKRFELTRCDERGVPNVNGDHVIIRRVGQWKVIVTPSEFDELAEAIAEFRSNPPPTPAPRRPVIPREISGGAFEMNRRKH